MSSIKWFNNFLFIENLLGVYRNYSSQKKIYKYLIVLQICIQTTLHAALVIYEIKFLSGANTDNPISIVYGIFASFAFITSLSSVVTSICYSHSFISYYTSMTRVTETFKDDKQFISSLNKTFWLSITFISLFIVFITYRSTQFNLFILQKNEVPDSFLLVSLCVSQALVRLTAVFQQVMMIVVILMIVHVAKCLTSLVSAVQTSIGSAGYLEDSCEICDITEKQIQGWVELYRDLANCCEKVTLSFGRQFVFALVMSMSYYVSLANHLCNKSGMWHSGDKRVVFIMLCFATLAMIPIIVIQRIRNEGMKFHRSLVRLYNTIIMIDSSQTKLIKDFIRVVKEYPLEIKLLSKMPTGMCMFPISLTLAVNYLIVILQFNNVV